MIPVLPALYVEHLVAPRSFRDVPEAQAAGEQGSMVGGFGVRVTLSWEAGANGEAVIGDVGARAFGSAAPIAPASLLVETVRGMTQEEAAPITGEQLLRTLRNGTPGTFPQEVHRGADFVVTALRCALGLPLCRPADPLGPGTLVCRCLDVGDRQVREAIRKGAATPEAVGDGCGASTGCRSCRPDILELIHEELHAPALPPPADLHPVARIAYAHVGPRIASMGIPLRDVRVTENAVHLVLGEREPDAPLSPQGARAIARRVLHDTVDEHLAVEVDGLA